LVAFGAFAQTTPPFDFATIQSDFNNFAQAVANSLPYNASIGLNWADAYIGSLFALPPHLGIGITVGATTIPYDAIEPILTTLGTDLGPDMAFAKKVGFPIPGYTIDARVGGIILPFDVGVKLGVIEPGMLEKLKVGFDANYLLAGADIRLALIQGDILRMSVGAGYSFMRGMIGLPGLLGGDQSTQITVPDPANPTQNVNYSLVLSDPNLNLNWQTNVIDIKAQASLFLLIFTPYIGVDASYGNSSAGGGLSSTLTMKDQFGNPVDLTQQQIDYLATQGITFQKDQGFTFDATGKSGWALTVFGGASLNLLILRLDLGVSYNLTSGSYGATVNVRAQL
jgi:hypothetical protein